MINDCVSGSRTYHYGHQRFCQTLLTPRQPHVVGAQLHRLSTVDAHTDVLKPIHGKII